MTGKIKYLIVFKEIEPGKNDYWEGFKPQVGIKNINFLLKN